MWGVQVSDRWEWSRLRQKIALFGLRNSLLVAPMPTASTSQILGNNECIEPYVSNIYSRRVSAGDFTVINHHLLKDLINKGLWTPAIRNALIENNVLSSYFCLLKTYDFLFIPNVGISAKDRCNSTRIERII